jgi:signal peptidase II
MVSPKIRRMILLMAMICATVGCDRITKHVAVQTLASGPARSFLAGTVRLEYAENQGAFLSLGAEMSPAWRGIVLTIGPGLLMIVILLIAIRKNWTGSPAVAASLIIAGGTSNLVDRLVRGSVVDFIEIGIGALRTGVFNLADVAIGVGVFLFVWAENHKENPE